MLYKLVNDGPPKIGRWPTKTGWYLTEKIIKSVVLSVSEPFAADQPPSGVYFMLLTINPNPTWPAHSWHITHGQLTNETWVIVGNQQSLGTNETRPAHCWYMGSSNHQPCSPTAPVPWGLAAPLPRSAAGPQELPNLGSARSSQRQEWHSWWRDDDLMVNGWWFHGKWVVIWW